MSDLISRSRAIENIWDVFNSYANDSLRFDEYETEAINNAFKVLQKVIEGQQTAYDVEKVVEELEERRAKNDCRVCRHFQNGKDECMEDCTDALIDDLLDIVRKGGVND